MKILLIIPIIFVAYTSTATIHRIKVANFQFYPKRVNAVVGDTVVWIYKNGFHTTSSTNIPAGAAAWDSPMDANTTKFTYIVTVPGIYNYFCLYHAAEMKGIIRVFPTVAAGIVADFTVQQDQNGKALLSWKLHDQKNIVHLSVQRSINGTDFTSFRDIDISRNNGNKIFSVTDEDTLAGFRNYLVAYTDKTNITYQTGILPFEYKQTQKMIIAISPNPLTAPHLLLTFHAVAAGTLKVVLLNAKGVKVKEAQMEAERGINSGHMHIGDTGLPAGTYYLVCTMGNLYERYTLIIP